MRTLARLLVLFALFALVALFAPAVPPAQATLLSDLAMSGRDPLQFTASGHVLGFEPTGVYVASGSGLLRLEFAGTAGVVPIAATLRSVDGRAQSLEPVTYANLWDGITVAFQPVPGGLFKSTYLLASGVAVDAIHLRYNVPVEVDASGSLTLRLPTGEYRESAPVAWQDIGGERVSVEVTFQPLAEREIGFRLGRYNPTYPLVIDPTLQWNTFLGSDAYDEAAGTAVDSNGNVYAVGYSYATWGSPKRPFNAGNYDGFVVKLSSSGTVVWNTFLGGASRDFGNGIALDSGGGIYVIGTSNGTWGDAPKRPYGGDDAFVAKLDDNGAVVWNTFLGGGSNDDVGTVIAVDADGNVYAAGNSYANWGSLPSRPYSGYVDGFVAKLGGDGTLLWNSFVGGSSFDTINGIAMDGSGNSYVTGGSNSAWGSPREPFHGTTSADAYVAKLNGSGFLEWNTFLGSASYDGGDAIAVDGNGSIYTTGTSRATWGNSPRLPYSGGIDIFVTGLDSNGILQWNTFLGGATDDAVRSITRDTSGNLCVTGSSGTTWGSPIRPHTGNGSYDAAVGKLDSSGALLWNTFLGGSATDFGIGSAVDGSGNIFVIGHSSAGWGSPLESFHGTTSYDVFVARIRKDNTTATLSAHTPNPSLPGQSVTISYTVAANPPGSLTPTGLVTVSDGTISCTDTIAVGHCDLTFATAGTKNLTATYAGNTDFVGSSSAVTGHQVNKASTTTNITGHTSAPSLPGQAVTISYTVAAIPPNSLTLTGSVTVSDGAVSCTDTVAAGHCHLSFATAGARNLTATFAGDTSFNGSISFGQAHLVNKANTTTSITGHTPNPSIVGQAYLVTWTVNVAAPAIDTPTGNVTVGDGSGGSCTAAVAVGHCTLASTSAGTKVLTATFSGDSDLNSSSSTANHDVKNQEVKNNQYKTYLPLLIR